MTCQRFRAILNEVAAEPEEGESEDWVLHHQGCASCGTLASQAVEEIRGLLQGFRIRIPRLYPLLSDQEIAEFREGWKAIIPEE